ncbi:MAG: P-loop NTPase fold protein [bacterium]|nr:P-loop NTPase fold protein [bacterium]
MVRVRPDQFDVDPDEPFERDRLDRRGRVEALCGLIERIESPAVIAVDGPFGSGKSVFVRMCAAHLRNREVAVAEFNAWQQSHSRWPLIDLVSALGSDATLAERLVGIAVNLVWRTARVGTRGLLDRDDFETPKDAARFEEWKQIEEKRAEFRVALTEVVAGANGKVVVVIDELDRCLPRHALDLLDVVRHLFDVPGVVVILGINQGELCERIKSLFGPECDADIYLRRFVDLTVDLPDPVPEQLAGFLVETFGGVGLRDRLRLSDYSGQIVGLLTERSEMSLRDIEQMVYRLAQVLSVVAAPRQDDLVESWASEQTAIALFTLRVADPTAYDQFRTGDSNALQAAADLSVALDLSAHIAAGNHTVMRMLAALIALDQFAGREEFGVDAIGTAIGDAGAAAAIWEHLRSFDSPWARSSRDGMIDIVELAVIANPQHQ